MGDDYEATESELLLRTSSAVQPPPVGSDKYATAIVDSGIGAEFLDCSMTKSTSLWKALSCHSQVLDTPEMSAGLAGQKDFGRLDPWKAPRSRSLSANLRSTATVAKGCEFDSSASRFPLTSAPPPIGTCWLFSDVESVDSAASSDEWDGLMTVGGEKVKIKEICELLSSRYAFISGAKTHRGHSIVTFPDVKTNLSFTEYKRMIAYLLEVPPMEDSYQGYVLVIDRRQDKWNAVKTLLLYISHYFPAKIHVIFVVKPESVLQKALEIGYRAVVDSCDHKVVLCYSLTELHCHLDKRLLTPDLGGDYRHRHLEWVQERMEIERMKASTQVISKSLSEFDQTLRETELPNDVETTQRLLDAQKAEKEAIKEDFRIAIRKGLSLLLNVRKADAKPVASQLSPNRLHNVTTVERLLVQLEETEKNFDKFWDDHEGRLQQCLQLRLFESGFKQLQMNFAMHMMNLEENRDVGDSIEKVEDLLLQHQLYCDGAKGDVVKAEELRAEGLKLIGQNHYAIDCSIRPKCQELKRLGEALGSALQRRTDVLKLSRQLQQQIGDANCWCSKGVKILSNQPIEIGSKDEAIASLRDLQDFLQTGGNLSLDSLKQLQSPELKNLILLATTDTSTLLQQVLARIDDVKTMCEKRVMQLESIQEKSGKFPKSPAKSYLKGRSISPRSPKSESPPHFPLEPFVRDHRFRRSKQTLNSPKKHIEVLHDYTTAEGSLTYASRKSSLTLPHLTHSASATTCTSADTFHLPRNSSASDCCLEPSTSRSDFIIQELISTELTYVTEMESVVDCYLHQFAPMAHLVPPALKDREEIIFSNLEDICHFHRQTFLKDLEAAGSDPSRVARCFLDRLEYFYLYNIYCQNKPKSEALRQNVGENNIFFQECQKLAGHRLPLGAYLLKPVQRITKYQLLLKELSKCAQSSDEIDLALSSMLELLDSVNASMYQTHISGYPGNLTSLGHPLLQGRFSVYTTKKSGEKGLRIRRTNRAQHRHIFLYEKVLVFCKNRTSTQGQPDSFEFKFQLALNDVGLTEGLRDSDTKFELWTEGRGEVYVLQAADAKSKDEWVAKIKQLLLDNFKVLKGGSLDKGERPVSWVSVTSTESSSTSRSSREMSTPEMTLRQVPGDSNNNPSSPTVSPSEASEQLDITSLAAISDGDNNFIPNAKSQFKAALNYTAGTEEEISLTAGELLTVLFQSDTNWGFVQRGTSTDKGWVPMNLLQSCSNAND